MKKFYAGIVLNKDELQESNCSRIELEYYKITKKVKENVNKKTNTYGIEIVKREYQEGRKTKEKSNLYNLTKDEQVINNILNILKLNKVTPIALGDVVEEVL